MPGKWINPPVTVSAIIREERRVLLGVRQNTNQFDLPGGFLEEGEDLEQALHREVFEETGVLPMDVRYFTSLVGTYFDGRKILSVYFTCRLARYDVSPSDELSGFEWVDRVPDEMYSPVDRIALQNLIGEVRC